VSNLCRVFPVVVRRRREEDDEEEEEEEVSTTMVGRGIAGGDSGGRGGRLSIIYQSHQMGNGNSGTTTIYLNIIS